MGDLTVKLGILGDRLAKLGRAIVAFSGGVDSTLVLKLARDRLGRQNVLAATGVSASLASRELRDAQQMAVTLDVPHELIQTAELSDADYRRNGPDRCYHCKVELYRRLTQLAAERGYSVVLNGVNADDAADHVHGIRAAREFAVLSPLADAALSKADVRELARRLGLPTWEKPALACLSSRIAYGTPVTIETLSRVEQAEAFLHARGFADFRVRHHEKLARVEVRPADLARLCAEPLRSELITHLKGLGYTYVTVDLQGFRSGSGNEATAAASAGSPATSACRSAAGLPASSSPASSGERR